MVDLTWDAVTDAGLAGYVVEQATTETGTYSPIQELNATTTSYTVPGLTNGTTYWFRVVAEDAAANRSAPSTTVQATPTAPVM